jgi:hypothetical protein
MNVVLIAEVAKLEEILGNFISTGLRLSHTRKNDMQRRFTGAARLCLPQEQDDITLEVWLHPSFGDCILETSKISVEELQGLLGSYLFTAMKASKRRKEEELVEEETLTSAVKVLKDDSGDRKLKVIVSFDVGLSIWNGVFRA